MKVRFFDRHAGLMGAGVPLPDRAWLIAGGYEGTEGDPAELVRVLREMYPEGEVKDVPPGDDFDRRRDFGMITLVLPATGFPRHCWRVIKYVPLEASP